MKTVLYIVVILLRLTYAIIGFWVLILVKGLIDHFRINMHGLDSWIVVMAILWAIICCAKLLHEMVMINEME